MSIESISAAKPLAGRRIGIFSPSRQLLDENLERDAEKFNRGLRLLKKCGASVVVFDSVFRNVERFAGTDEERAAAVPMLKELDLDCALALRGGYGAARVLSELGERDFSVPKIVGYSDATALQTSFFTRFGTKSIAGPTFSDFCSLDEEICIEAVQALAMGLGGVDLEFESPCVEDFEFEGVCWGGNLSVAASIVGTRFFCAKAAAERPCAFFFEDVAEPAYRIERMLWTLIESGALGSVKVVLVGSTSGADRPVKNAGDFSLASALSYLKKRLPDARVVEGLPFGHEKKRGPLPVGSLVRITSRGGRVRIKEL